MKKLFHELVRFPRSSSTDDVEDNDVNDDDDDQLIVPSRLEVTH
jgi:hypothetical protein